MDSTHNFELSYVLEIVSEVENFSEKSILKINVQNPDLPDIILNLKEVRFKYVGDAN